MPARRPGPVSTAAAGGVAETRRSHGAFSEAQGPFLRLVHSPRVTLPDALPRSRCWEEGWGAPLAGLTPFTLWGFSGGWG